MDRVAIAGVTYEESILSFYRRSCSSSFRSISIRTSRPNDQQRAMDEADHAGGDLQSARTRRWRALFFAVRSPEITRVPYLYVRGRMPPGNRAQA